MGKDPDNQNYVIDQLGLPLRRLKNLHKNVLTSPLLQIKALILREFKKPPLWIFKVAMMDVMDGCSYNRGSISLYPSYIIFLEELIRKDAKFMADYTNKLMTICHKLIQVRMDVCFFRVLNALLECYP